MRHPDGGWLFGAFESITHAARGYPRHGDTENTETTGQQAGSQPFPSVHDSVTSVPPCLRVDSEAGLSPLSALRPPPSAAFFDVDGTLVHGTVIHYYAWLLGQEGRREAIRPPCGPGDRPRAARPRPERRGDEGGRGEGDRSGATPGGGRGESGVAASPCPRVPASSLASRLSPLACLAARLPRYWWLDRQGRDHFLRAFYRNYAGYTPDGLASLQEALFREVTQPRLLPEGEATVRSHREAGQRVVILSASLRFVLEPLACYLGVDELICQEMSVRDGALTGELEGPPLSGEERAARLREYAHFHELDLAASYAYGDSSGDIPMLAAVGHPVAVNPSRSLRREAQRRGWPIVRWKGVASG